MNCYLIAVFLFISYINFIIKFLGFNSLIYALGNRTLKTKLTNSKFRGTVLASEGVVEEIRMSLDIR